ncbi:MAG TPA: M23 family metallopeptidase [Pyrinomonadaceae bacterium]|jgi:hypothetical protein
MNFSHYVPTMVNGKLKQILMPLPPPPPDGEMALDDLLTYFVYGFDLGPAPEPFAKGTLRLIANYKIGERCGATVREIPAANLQPVTLAPPVVGRWRWGNSPNHTTPDAHAWPHQRFAVDLTKVDENNSTRMKKDDGTYADPGQNKSYYDYGQPVLAMAAGAVRSVHDTEPENNGDKGDSTKGVNYIHIEHAPDEYSTYYHLRTGTSLVKVGDKVKTGQQIAQVGNSGGSSQPHLHIAYVKLDATGRGTLYPMQFTDLRTATDGQTVKNVPATDVYFTGPLPELLKPPQWPGPRLTPPDVYCDIMTFR